MKPAKDIIRQALVLVTVLLTIAVNSLANALPLNGQTTGEISDRFPVYFVPAGYVFSIWGLIYLALIAFAVYQALPAQRQNPRLRSISGLFILSSAANMAWIFLWHYELFPLTLVAMLVLLASLAAIYLRLRGGSAPEASRGERYFVRLPFSIYLGWITVATIANVTALLSYLGWNGWGISPEAWTVIMLAVATAVGGLVAYFRRDTAYLLVLVWAFLGIALKHAGVPVVATAAFTAAIASALLAIAARFSPRRSPVLQVNSIR